MVQSVENLSNLTGTVIGRLAHPTLDGYDVLDVEVESTAPVDDRPDLLASTIGTRVAVTVDRTVLDRRRATRRHHHLSGPSHA